MAFIHIATSKGHGLDSFKQVEDKVESRESIDGLLVESFGQDGDYVRHVSIWESKAHKDRSGARVRRPRLDRLVASSRGKLFRKGLRPPMTVRDRSRLISRQDHEGSRNDDQDLTNQAAGE